MPSPRKLPAFTFRVLTVAAWCVLLSIASAAWAQSTLITLHTFTGPDGAYSYAPLVRDRAGNLYGTTAAGGTFNVGTIFKIDTFGNETVLYNFKGRRDGGNPRSGLLLDSTGNLFGITASGGTGSGQGGVLFKLTPSGQQIILHSFSTSDGAGSASGLLRDSSGNFYGTTEIGGAHNQGVVFKLDPHGNYSILYSFTGRNGDGSEPFAGLVRDQAGNLYGTTFGGGSFGLGTVFKIDASGNESVLYSFVGGNDGLIPSSTLVLDPAGNLYGTTDGGGTYNRGTVFEIDSNGNESILHTFGATDDGASPFVGLVRDKSGNLYGVTDGGGADRHGSVFKLDSSGNETVLYSFTGGLDGARPEAALTLDQSGNLYGTTLDKGAGGVGTVFTLKLP